MRKPPRRSARRALALAALAVALIGLPASAPASDLFPDWTIIDESPFPLFDPPEIVNPVFTRHDVDDEQAVFVADPFLFREAGVWYLFFEVYRPAQYGWGYIGVATSQDAVNWSYAGPAIDDDTNHLSYPHVFKWGEDFYMTPCLYPSPEVRLYRTSPEDFPFEWSPVAAIVTGHEPLADPTVFRHGDLWWMFVANSTSNTCWLYYSDDLEDPDAWIEHHSSPIIRDDRGRARPGGRVVVLGDGRIFRPAQKCWPLYGEELRLFEVTVLNTEFYAEQEVPESPILLPSGIGWNAERMHQCDPWWTGLRWLAAVDGNDGNFWSIGIYLSDQVTAAGETPAAAGTRLWSEPNPFNPRTTLRFELDAAAVLSLDVYDVAGKRVRVLCAGVPYPAGPGRVPWDGRDDGGHALSSGVYLCELKAGETCLESKLLLLR